MPLMACSRGSCASGNGFGRTAAKVEVPDHFFTGFPSYWNIVAFYLFVLEWPPAANAAVLLMLAALVFVPMRFVYPSRTRAFSMLTHALGVTWAIIMFWMLWRLPVRDVRWLAVSFVFPVYYAALSIWLDRTSPGLKADA